MHNIQRLTHWQYGSYFTVTEKLRQLSLCTVRIMWNEQTQSVGKMQSLRLLINELQRPKAIGFSWPSDCLYSFFLAQHPISDLGRLLVELYRLHTIRHTPVELFWTSDQLVTEAVTYTTYNGHKRQTAMPSAGFEQVIPAIKRLQFRALNRPPRAASHKVNGREIVGWWFLSNCICWELEMNC